MSSRSERPSSTAPERWPVELVKRRRLVEALCQRAAVFLKGDQGEALRKALLEPSSIRDEELPSILVLEVREGEHLFTARQSTIELTQQWAATRMMRTRAATIVLRIRRNTAG